MKRLLTHPIYCLLAFSFLISSSVGAYAQQQQPLPVEDLQRFVRSLDMVKRYYVKEIDDKAVFENAIRGMLSGLDPHSAYLDKKDYEDLQVSTSGKFGGVGIEVTMERDVVKVISPIDDTPAYKAGIQAGDLIIKIDETPVRGLKLRDAVDKMRGDVGAKVNLTILRKGEKKPLSIDVVRDRIVVRSVKSKIYDESYGYIRVSQFQEKTGRDLIKTINKMKHGSKGKIKGLVLDLRNNPGGLLNSAVDVSEVFLDKNKLDKNKKIVYAKGRFPGSSIEELVQDNDMTGGIPIVVLVNGGSASASEIVAGALQDHRRAVVMGTKTFGKGSVQTILPLPDKTALKMTTALYYTPKGRSIQAQGIEPDIKVEKLKLKIEESKDFSSISEADLDKHLAAVSPKKKDKSKNSSDKLVESDYQLYSAINLLKGMTVVNPKKYL
ncbi:S41 family peptidase [Piscirickettsia litoralis]|uniref:Peptidase S41 n=1 Tax=Piscirickettsia litoralis TaxID=1891921 RepID=A0ABX3A2I8_9GAMM|nr:S41 family peptidase [Piscirickettsia litoralis]ODN43082.1 peptidase S41 [Piscirickettsia litoralis]